MPIYGSVSERELVELGNIKQAGNKTIATLRSRVGTVQVYGGRSRDETIIHEANACRSGGEKIHISNAQAFAKIFLQTAHNVDYPIYKQTIVMSPAVTKQFLTAINKEVAKRRAGTDSDTEHKRLEVVKTMAAAFANGKCR
jgi:hypothetical protein